MTNNIYTGRPSALTNVDPALFDQIEKEIDDIKQRYRAKLGPKDIAYIKGLRRNSRIFEAIGRGLLWVSPEPITFTLGVFFTFLHRNIESIEIGHNVLHGQYDYFPEIPQFHAHNFKWKAPVDEEGWRREHNGLHHVHTNVFEMDPDLNHGILRTNELTPWNKRHLFQVPIYLFGAYPTMLYQFNAQNLGFGQKFRERAFPEGNKGYALVDTAGESDESLNKRHSRAIWRVLAKSTDALKHKGHWYLSQLESSVNFKGSRRMSILWGHLNYQIEHHLFPDIPSHHYPDMAKEVKVVCKKYGVDYKCNPSWGRAIRNYMSVMWKHSFPPASQAQQSSAGTGHA